MRFGERLKYYRRRAGVPLRELGAAADMDYVVICKIEGGTRRAPGLDRLLLIADALRLSGRELEELIRLTTLPNGNSPARYPVSVVDRILNSRAARELYGTTR